MISPHHITQAVERAQQALSIAQEKPSPKGQGGGSSNVEPPMPLPAGVISAKRELRDMLLDWVGLVSEGLAVVAHCDPTEASMLTWLGSGERADHLAAHEAAQDFLDELTEVTKQIEAPYAPRRFKAYIGNYGGGAVYVREGQDTVELADGTTVPVLEIRDTNTDIVLNKTGTALQVSRIIKAYFGFDIEPKKIKDAERYDRKKAEGGKLEHIRTDNGAYVYKVEDVLNRLCLKHFSPKT